MGMLHAGNWVKDDEILSAGNYERPKSVFNQPIPSEVVAALVDQPGRFHLIVSHSCPWSHRALLIRALKNLELFIPVHVAHGPRVQGYSANGGVAWHVPGAGQAIIHLHELYTLSASDYSGRVTVPILWDSERQEIVSNESTQIMRAFDAVRLSGDATDFTFYPQVLWRDIDAINTQLYEGFSNGVYRALFATSQGAYNDAVGNVFDTLATLDLHLSTKRFLMGSVITEADWRILPTLMRFDAIYYIEHRCCFRRLTDYPNVWAYARDLYAWNKVANTLSLDTLRKANYAIAGSGVTPVAPDADWTLTHGREKLAHTTIILRTGQASSITPATFSVATC